MIRPTVKSRILATAVADLVIIGLAIPSMFGQKSQPAKPNTAATVSNPTSAMQMPMPLVAPLFIEDEERTGVVTMVNSASEPVDVDLVLYSLAGDQIASRSLTVSAHSQQAVAVWDVLGDSGIQYGSIFIVPHRSTSLAAQLSISGRNGASTNDIEEEFQMLMSSSPANYRGVSASKDPVIAVRSLSMNQEALSVTCLAGETASSGSISIDPGKTLLIDACAEGGPTVVTVLGARSKSLSHRQKATAVTVSSFAAQKDLAVFGFGLAGAGPTHGFVAVPLADVNTLKSSTAVVLGASTVASSVTSKLHAAIANFGALPHHAKVVGAQDGAQQTLADVQLAPNSVSFVDLTHALSGSGGSASLLISTDGAPGEVLSDLQVLGEQASSSVTLPWKDRDQMPNSGHHPWRIDAGFNSTLMLFNPDIATANTANLVIYAGGAAWSKKIPVPPATTVLIRLNDIIEKQEADDAGATLPRDAANGIAVWRSSAEPRIMGQLIHVDSTSGVIRPFACSFVTQLCGVSMTGVNVAVGSQATTIATPMTCSTNGDCTCVDGPALCQYDSSYFANFSNWFSGNTSVATISGSGSQGTVTGVAVGSTDVGVSATDAYFCPAQGQAQVAATPKCPTTVSIASTAQLPLQSGLGNNFDAGWRSGFGIMATMQVGPGDGYNGQTITESVYSGFNNNCPASVGYTCSGNSTWTIGPTAGGTYQGTFVPGAGNNQFQDTHLARSMTDLLDGTSLPPASYSCTQACGQTYTACNQQVGTFTITRTFTHSMINGTPVTLVTVTKN
jgi:hypothetical protein